MIWDIIPEGCEVVLCSPAPFLIQHNAIKVQKPSGSWVVGKITDGLSFMTNELDNLHLQAELTRWHQAGSFSEIAEMYQQKRKLVLLLLKIV